MDLSTKTTSRRMQFLGVVVLLAAGIAAAQAKALVAVRLPRDADDISPTPVTTSTPDENTKPDIYSLHVESNITYRYAKTVVSSRVANPRSVAQEVAFTVTLPESAFVSEFLMEIKGEVYKAYVKEKEEAKKEYDAAVSAGRAAGHVAINPRDSTRFTVSVNVEAQGKVTFNLTYEELLTRRLGEYQHVVSIDPGQIVRDLTVDVSIEESAPIIKLEAPALRTSNEISDDPSESSNSNPLAQVSQPTPEKATVHWAPTTDQQRELNKDGVKGQLVVRYDVDRSTRPGDILISDGYFVHFFAPEDLTPLNKHVAFVLDLSGSMSGRRLQQLKEAMSTILSDLKSGDYFSLVLFSSTVQIWTPSAVQSEDFSNAGEVGSAAIVAASADNIASAKDFVSGLHTLGSTNIEAGLRRGLELLTLGKNTLASSDAGNTPEPMVLFLTDGQPNEGESNPDRLVDIVHDLNNDTSVSVFSLAFGDYADLPFLKKLSLRNNGFARKIYEASDAALQLKDFYRQIASPLLADVTFSYQEGEVQNDTVTRRRFPTFFRGTELVVAGKAVSPMLSGQLFARSPTGHTSFSFGRPIVLPDLPIIAIDPPVAHVPKPGFAERLWAYLTIQQLLEEQNAAVADNSTKQHALDLALKYSFVTPLTSLVVVKPNETEAETSATSTDGSSDSNHRSGAPHFASSFGAPGAGGFAGPYPMVPASAHASFPAAQGGYGSSGPQSSGPLWMGTGAGAGLMSGNSGYQGVPYPIPSVPRPTYHTTTVSHTTKSDSLAVPALVPLSDIAWLVAATNGSTVLLPTGQDGGEEALQLGADQSDDAHEVCSTPDALSGHCRHLPHCPLSAFKNDVSEFLPYMCRIESYIGVCCPDNLKTQS